MDRVQIGDICEILNGFAFKSENYVESGIRIIRIANVQKGYIEDSAPVFYPKNEKGIEKYRLESGDLLMSLTGNVGRVAILTDEYLPAALNQRVACLRMKTDRVSKGYLFHILNSNFFEDQCIQAAKGVAQKNMSTEWLKEYEIPLFPKSKQTKIVSILDNVSSVITKRQQQLSDLDDLIKARFVEMFGDPICNTHKLSTKVLKDLLALKAGEFTASSDIADKPTETNKYPCYGGNGIRGYVADYNQEGEYSLIGRQGALSGNVQFAKGRFKNTEHALLVSPKTELNAIWLNHLLIRLDLKRYQTGAAQPGLSVKNLQEIPIIVVSLDKQDVFAEFVAQVNKSKSVIQKSLDETQLLFDSLMQKYFG